jgi:hypothetical protein
VKSKRTSTGKGGSLSRRRGDNIPPLSVIPFLTSLTCSSEASFLNRTYHNQPTFPPTTWGTHTIYDGILETVLVVNGLIKQTLTNMLLLLLLLMMDGRRAECEGSDSWAGWRRLGCVCHPWFQVVWWGTSSRVDWI